MDPRMTFLLKTLLALGVGLATAALLWPQAEGASGTGAILSG